ncbi:MAG: YjgN family protein [Acidiferrobacterales bacterium]
MERSSAHSSADIAATGPADTLTLEFRGCAREYFRIWIVNLCLTLLTLGIFSAWAKVRKKRYFYSYTTLNGTPFQYLARPAPILKGRIIAAVVFSVYYLAAHIVTPMLPYVLLAGVVLAPWVVVRSVAFNARYSAYRNMAFAFNGTYQEAAKSIYWLGVIPAIVAGMMFRWWGHAAAGGVAFLAFGAVFPWWLSRFKKFLVSHTCYGGENGQLSVSGGQFWKIYFVAGMMLVGAGMVAGIVMGASSAFGASDILQKSPIFLFIAIYCGYVLGFAYIQAHSTNLVWNNTRLGPLRFESLLRGRGMAKLYVTNALAIIGSAGLLIPWAVIRTLRYRLTNMRVKVDGALGQLRGGENAPVQAVGAEIGEFFNVDLSL